MILDKIVSQISKDLEVKKATIPFDSLVNSFNSRAKKPINMLNVLRKNKNANTYNVICEVKKASPSKGVIREDFDPIQIAKYYEKSGASCISVLTEEHFFQGSLEYLKDISNIVETPLLRKDFFIDKYQIAEAYLCGADMILLIAKILDRDKMKDLLDYASSLGLYSLVEVHDKEDLEKALDINADIIGINHRNLDDFSMNMDLSYELSKLIPEDKIIVAESGISNAETLHELDKINIDAFLIGEHFMREDDLEKNLSSFITKVN